MYSDFDNRFDKIMQKVDLVWSLVFLAWIAFVTCLVLVGVGIFVWLVL